ncbi:hypothetical protein DVH24_001528 [Malus domestica]|uniref:Mos1 transposase HTH domain-containing protein n=1 Tax=Malus domestica TaxID=3750 RepID=A0A498K4U9_MALDO|nr:hypothetical protein DVH24_001528 [Malus domestica]
MCGHTRENKIRNEDIQGKLGVAEIENNVRENWFKWFKHEDLKRDSKKRLRLLGSNGKHVTKPSAIAF